MSDVLDDIVREVGHMKNVGQRFDNVTDKIVSLMNRYGLELGRFEEDFDEKIIEYIENLRKEHNGE